MLMLTDCRCNQGLPIPEDSGTPGAATMCSSGLQQIAGTSTAAQSKFQDLAE